MKIAGQNPADNEIIEALQNKGEELNSAVRYLYKAHFGSLAHFIKTNSGSDLDAEECFNEALFIFVDMVQKKKFRGDSSIKTFLYAILRNLWLNELKKRSRTLQRETLYYDKIEKEEKDVQTVIHQNEAKRQVLDIFEKLGENCKKILVLFYYEEMPMKKIFRAMGYESEQVARNMKSKCMKRLNELLESNAAVKQSLKNLLVNG